MTTVPYLLLDVFTSTQFAGNPLAVVIDPPGLTTGQMSQIAKEFNLSETIFLLPDGDGRWATRIFTPGKELAFAGHPTVGAAIALALSGAVSAGEDGVASIVLAQGAGDVPVELRFGEVVERATFVAPHPPRLAGVVAPEDALAILLALGLGPADALTALDVGIWDAGVPITVVPLASVEALGRARPDLALLAEVVDGGTPPEFFLLAPDSSHGDRWRARMFAPGIGIPEDPATGAAACAAAGLLASVAVDGEASWLIEQGVEMGRPSLLDLSATVRNGVAEQARLGGGAVLVGTGSLYLSD